jgi:2-polyprenyl-3-methyl-5-hydroxy-6-metoxy-1,4-benzoquinol methylase
LAEVRPRPDEDDIERYYREAFDRGGYGDVLAFGEQVKRRKFECFSDWIHRSTGWSDGSGRRVLDVGCSDGVFLEVFRDRNPGADVFGVDLSEKAVRLARGRLGVDAAYCGRLTAAEVAARGPFDLITMFDVLEHVPDLDSVMRPVGRLLRPGALVVLTTPFWTGIPARLLGSRWPYFCPPEHVTFFSPQAVESLAEKYGYAVQVRRKAVKYFSVTYLNAMSRHLMPRAGHLVGAVLALLPNAAAERPFPAYVGETFVVLGKSRDDPHARSR